MTTFTSTGSTFNLSNGDARPATPVSTGGWSDVRADLLEQLGHLGQLIEALRALFGPGVAAPLREALSDVRGLELGLVDAVIDNEGRYRSQVAELQQHLNRAIAARDEVIEREAEKDRRLAEAALEELARSRRQNRPVSLWARRTIDAESALLRGGWPSWVPERDRQWLRDCRTAIESGWADACQG